MRISQNGGVMWYTRRRKHPGGWARPCSEQFTRRELGSQGRCPWCQDTLHSDGTSEAAQPQLL